MYSSFELFTRSIGSHRIEYDPIGMVKNKEGVYGYNVVGRPRSGSGSGPGPSAAAARCTVALSGPGPEPDPGPDPDPDPGPDPGPDAGWPKKKYPYTPSFFLTTCHFGYFAAAMEKYDCQAVFGTNGLSALQQIMFSDQSRIALCLI